MDGRAKDYALRLLSVRDRSRQELEDRLRRKGFGADDIDEVLSDLESAGLIDDDKFARAFVHSKAGRLHGRRRILYELHAKGISDRIARQALADAYDEAAIKTNARSRALKLLEHYSHLDRRAREEKIYQYFARRGHESEFIREVLRTSIEES